MSLRLALTQKLHAIMQILILLGVVLVNCFKKQFQEKIPN